MNKIRTFAALVTLALCIGVFGTAGAQEPRTTGQVWKSVDVTFRASKGTAVIGTTDSVWRYNGGLADIDTSLAINVSDMVYAADSAQFIKVEWLGQNAFASGESLYVTFDGQASDGVFTDLGLATCGTCMAGGYGAAGSLVPGTNKAASRWWNGAGSATAVNVAQGSSPLGPGKGAGFQVYGNFAQFPVIRLRVKSDSAVVPVSNLVKVRIWYLSTDPTPHR